MIDCHDNGDAEQFQVFDMSSKVRAAILNSRDILGPQISLADAAVHLHRAYRGNQHNRLWRNTGLAALDVHELFGSEIGTKASFGHHIIGQFQCRFGGHHRIAAMRNIGKRPTMYKSRIIFKRLHNIRLHSLLQQNGHRPVSFDVAGIDRRTIATVSHNDIAQTFFKISQIVRQT